MTTNVDKHFIYRTHKNDPLIRLIFFGIGGLILAAIAGAVLWVLEYFTHWISWIFNFYNANFWFRSITHMIVFLVLLIFVAAYMTYLERKLVGFFQRRLGPMRCGPYGLLQCLADALKLLFKEELDPGKADRFAHLLAPAIVLIAAYAGFSIIPITDWFYVTDVSVGVLFLLGFSSLGAYGVILSGWSSGSKYSFLGSIRSCSQMISYELSMGLAFLIPIMLTGTMSVKTIVHWWNSGAFVFTSFENWFLIVPVTIAFITYIISGVAETNRAPFDLPEAENELVAGYHTEYTSMKFALFFLGEYLNIAAVCAIATAVFLGGWYSPFGPFLELIAGKNETLSAILSPLSTFILPIGQFFWFMVKWLGLVFVFIWLRATLPRLRFDQLQNFGWKFLIPLGMYNVMLTGTLLVLKVILQGKAESISTIQGLILLGVSGFGILGFIGLYALLIKGDLKPEKETHARGVKNYA